MMTKLGGEKADENNNREPLLHIVKRGALPWYKAWGIRLLAIVIALIVCAIVTMTVTGENPIQVYATMLDSSFGSERKVWIFAQSTAMLLGVSLAVTPAFKMKFWNIGGEGQILAGCLAAAACMICLADTVSNGLLIAISAVASIAAGAIWGGIPAFFKAKWNTNETLFTLMMNYVATQLVAFSLSYGRCPRAQDRLAL